MPHVASALNNHVAHNRPAARPSQASDRASSTPFASLLDDNTPAPERPPQPAADDQGTRAARSDQTSQPAKSTDCKTTKAKDDASAGDAGKTDKADKADNTEQAVGDAKVVVDAISDDGKAIADANIAKPTEEKDATPVNMGKPADALVTADAATAPPTDPMPTIPTTVATVTVLPPATGNAATASELPPAAGNAATAPTPAKTDALAAVQPRKDKAEAGKDKADTGATLATDAAAQPHGEVKPQGLVSDTADKDAIAHARGEAPQGEHADNAHHVTSAQASAALTADAITTAPKAGADIAPPIVHTAPMHTTAPAGPNPAANAPLPQPAAIPFAGVAIEIASKALAGKNHFEIRLDPPELGRIEVRLDVDRDGNVISRMIADRADTLDLLRRDASGLERALQDAGLKTSDNGLQFSLRDQSAQQEQAGRASETARLVVEDNILPAADVAPRSYSRLAGLGSGVDIHV